MSKSEKLHTYPSPYPTSTVNLTVVGLWEGWVRSYSDKDIDPVMSPFTETVKSYHLYETFIISFYIYLFLFSLHILLHFSWKACFQIRFTSNLRDHRCPVCTDHVTGEKENIHTRYKDIVIEIHSFRLMLTI